MCISILGCMSFSSVLTDGHSRPMGRQVLPMLSSLPGISIGNYRFQVSGISSICPVEIDRLKMIVG